MSYASLLRRFLNYLKRLLAKPRTDTILLETLVRGKYATIVRVKSSDPAAVSTWRVVEASPPNRQVWITCYSRKALGKSAAQCDWGGSIESDTHNILIVLRSRAASKKLLEKSYNLIIFTRKLHHKDVSETVTEMIARSFLNEFKFDEICYTTLCDYFVWIATISKLENAGSDWWIRKDIEAQMRKRQIKRLNTDKT